MTSIIQKQTIALGSQFEAIKETIQSNEQFFNLASISSFNSRNATITFQTEKIHPPKNRKNQSPILLLFSNPHPLSVASGMFLSEPHSRAFWERLFSCNCMQPNKKLMKCVPNWKHETIKILTENLLSSTYSDQVSLYFDCLESLPTNQYSDLKKSLPKKQARNYGRILYKFQAWRTCTKFQSNTTLILG